MYNVEGGKIQSQAFVKSTNVVVRVILGTH